MKTLCQAAGIKYFRFHALRHPSALFLDQRGARIGDTQRILGRENHKTIASISIVSVMINVRP
jgi:site-specific recombinase XerD